MYLMVCQPHARLRTRLVPKSTPRQPGAQTVAAILPGRTSGRYVCRHPAARLLCSAAVSRPAAASLPWAAWTAVLWGAWAAVLWGGWGAVPWGTRPPLLWGAWWPVEPRGTDAAWIGGAAVITPATRTAPSA